MILCQAFVNEGFPDLASGFMDGAAAVVRRHGGILIADEVQSGFGRIGSHFWGHQWLGFTPDAVTMGKPMGNGHPVAALASSADIMTAFRRAFRCFNTFGGNLASCVAANAVMDVLISEDLPARAAATGAYLRAGLSRLAERHEVLGHIRGSGLAIGVEIVSDRAAKTPDAGVADDLANAMRQEGELLGTNGIYSNILKIRPPMPFGRDEAHLLLDRLDKVLAAVPAR